jgi:hypothetical protein
MTQGETYAVACSTDQHPPTRCAGRGRRGTRAWIVGVALSVVAALGLGMPSMGSAGGDHDGDDHDFPCKGLKGTCFGLCLAEEIARCDEKPDTIICRLLERKMQLHKCTEPPPATCPCQGLTAGGASWSVDFETIRCNIIGASGQVQLIDAATNVLMTGTIGDSCTISGVGGFIDLPTNATENAACIDSLRAIAERDLVTCQ